MVLTFERFWHLEFLIKFVEHGCEVIPFSQAVPFFTNSDFDAPAVPVPAAQVLEWVLHNISASLERVLEKTPTKENGSTNAANLDMAIADGSINNSPSYSRSQTFVESIFKASVMKQACDIKGNSIKVLNCHDSVIYVLAPLKYATVYGCCESIIILGAIGKAVRVEHCERVQIITAARRICIANCRECVFFLGVNQQPLIIGDNHKLQVAPYNTFYPQLEEHMAQLGINVTVNRWNEPYVLLKLLEEMKISGTVPDDITFVGVLTACTHGGLIEEGREYFKSMYEDCGVRQEMKHYGCIIDMLGRDGLLGKAEGIVKRMLWKPDAAILGALLGACRIHRNVEIAARIQNEFLELESEQGGCHFLLSNIYANADKWADSIEMREVLKEKGIKKKAGSSYLGMK